MLIVYRILNYILNSLLILILLFWAFAILKEGENILLRPADFITGVVLAYSALTSGYFAIKTSRISAKYYRYA